MVSITNAINWLDGIDGLAGGYCGILSIGLFLIMFINGNFFGILSFSIILGILIGFVIRNFKPAFYIMGDCGSNFLGYFFSASSILFLSNPINGSVEIINLLIIFSLPLGDMFFVISERFMNNQNIFLPNKNHIHHRLMNLNIGYSYIILILFSYSALSISVGIFYLLNI
jgi:UDP-GlcNAc:undecaprenyl-phosphate GlcNAc-1-phosphate transferase